VPPFFFLLLTILFQPSEDKENEMRLTPFPNKIIDWCKAKNF